MTMMYDMILANVMGMMITFIVTKFDTITEWMISMMSMIYYYYYPQPDNAVITVSATVTTNSWGTYTSPSDAYSAVIYQLHKKQINLHKIKQLPGSNGEHNYYIIYPKPILLDSINNIKIESYSINEDIDKGKKQTIYIELSTPLLKVYQLKEKLQEWILEYNMSLRQYKFDGTIIYYSIDSITYKKEENASGGDPRKMDELFYNQHQQRSFKTMDNVFFKDKEQVISRLQAFINGREQYARRGIPYNLGLLLYGEPGCGKTSFIKALSSYTNRHILDINLRKIETCGEFYKLFTNEMLNDTYVPIDKRIIVLEDIDCMGNIVSDRATSAPAQEHASSLASASDKEDSKTPSEHLLELFGSRKKYKEHDSLNLSCILNCIDGTYEQSGRIMVITTNYPDKLDKALIRAGRIDSKVHFTKCNKKMLVDILEHFYDKPCLMDKLPEPDPMPTPADVLEYCFNEPDIEKAKKYFFSSVPNPD